MTGYIPTNPAGSKPLFKCSTPFTQRYPANDKILFRPVLIHIEFLHIGILAGFQIPGSQLFRQKAGNISPIHINIPNNRRADKCMFRRSQDKNSFYTAIHCPVGLAYSKSAAVRNPRIIIWAFISRQKSTVSPE